MTMETWKAEFYPVPADTPMTDIEALEFSIQKWKGYRKENLDRHGLEVDPYCNADIVQLDYNERLSGQLGRPAYRKVAYFSFNSDTCPLCHIFLYANNNCSACVITKQLGMACHGFKGSAYREFRYSGDPEPMIKLLETTLELVKQKAGTTRQPYTSPEILPFNSSTGE